MLETINTGFFGTIENVTTHFVCNRFTSSDILRDHTLHIEASLVGFDDRPVENRLKCFPVRKRLFQCYSDVVLYLSIREGGGKSLFGGYEVFLHSLISSIFLCQHRDCLFYRYEDICTDIIVQIFFLGLGCID